MSRAPRAATNNQAYQGFPYSSPPVNDAPSLNADEIAALSKWNNLPKRTAGTPIKTDEHPPVVYIDIPDDGGGATSRPTQPTASSQPRPTASSNRRPLPKKEDDVPVVYIDIPEGSGSEVSQNRVEEQTTEPEYVQETIFYDPFKDRRIDLREEEDSDLEDEAPQPIPPHRRPPPRPIPPSSLNFNTPGSSGFGSASTPGSNIPSFMTKESYVYGRQPTPDDGFPLSPIPVSDFPIPPPAYEEIDSRIPRPEQRPVVEQPRQGQQNVQITQQTPPPQVQVITSPQYPGVVGLPDQNRKFLHCQHCGSQVHTLVIRENGKITHIFAWLVMLCCLYPITALIYLTNNCCKYKNHYCPNCNKKIGYVEPGCCVDMTYT